MKVLSKLGLEPVDNWRRWYKLASMQLLAVGASLIGFCIANPTWLYSYIWFMPEEKRYPLALGTTILIIVLVGATRLIKKKDKPDGKPTPDTESE